jgi:hypothetical protein
MLTPKYSTILAVTGTTDENLPEAEGKAQRDLLNHVLLQRMGIDMEGRLGITSSRGRLAEVYVEEDAEAKTPEEKAKKAVKKVNALILAFNSALDKLHFPNMAQSHGRT